MFDYLRVSTAVPSLKLADVDANVKAICDSIKSADDNGATIIAFPELSLTGATCGDLYFQRALLNAVKSGVKTIADATASINTVAIIGAPLTINKKLYDCAVVLAKGRVQGIVPKVLADSRWFDSADEFEYSFIDANSIIGGVQENYAIPAGQSVFNVQNAFGFSVLIGEDAFAPIGLANSLAANGAEVIVNISAYPQTVGKEAKILNAARYISDSNICVFATVSAGKNESTSDSVFAGTSIIAQSGKIVKTNEQFIDDDYILITDVDLGAVKSDRIKNETFKKATAFADTIETVDIVDCDTEKCNGEYLEISKTPFIPEDLDQRIDRCCDIFDIQVEALKRRVEITNSKLVIGISGGLDSTLALLVSVECMKRLNRPLTDIYGITMPCFGTSDRTLQNSLKLMELLGITSKTISIKDACVGHFKDIGHDANNFDATYENAQARERTQVLMDFAGEIGGLVVGTGDLSELALGWCTYNGDHMSMYSVNCGVPKTLIRHIIASLIDCGIFAGCDECLTDIVDTPISPELLPPDAKGEIAQVTEDIVGPYVLHDFFLYYVVRYGYEPQKIYDLAKKAFVDDFDDETINKWLKSFYRRFFTQQFKRNCVPDGVKVGSISLSPRGEFKMPSDAVSSIWLSQLDNI